MENPPDGLVTQLAQGGKSGKFVYRTYGTPLGSPGSRILEIGPESNYAPAPAAPYSFGWDTVQAFFCGILCGGGFVVPAIGVAVMVISDLFFPGVHCDGGDSCIWRVIYCWLGGTLLCGLVMGADTLGVFGGLMRPPSGTKVDYIGENGLWSQTTVLTPCPICGGERYSGINNGECTDCLVHKYEEPEGVSGYPNPSV